MTLRMRDGLPGLRDPLELAIFEQVVREVHAIGDIRITHFCLLWNPPSVKVAAT